MRCFPTLLAGAVALGCLGGAAMSQEPEKPKNEREPATGALPLSEVVLYTSGVGYFQRDGKVDGDAQVDLRFKVDDINDLLKSMVVQDFDGGQVATVTYGSRDPLTKTLKSFGVDLTSNPTLGQLLGQIRGERIRVEAPNAITGVILGVETKKQPAGKDHDAVVEAEYLNLLTDDGLRSVPLAEVKRIKLLNERLDSELKQALQVLAAGHDTQKKTVSIRFDGNGQRRVSVSYITETPVWKTSYRLVLDDKEKPFLQGWAIVENTSDDDWNDVRLSLVSGRPISFIMDMYQPLYARRPVVVPELYASLGPQVYGEAMEQKDKEVAMAPPMPMAGEPAAAPAAPAPMFRSRSGGMMAGMGGGMGGRAISMAAPAREATKMDLGRGIAPSAQGGQTGELFEYAIKTPVTLARQKSAMLPIISDKVDGQKVSIYNASVQAKYPLNGFRLKNTTNLYLMQGPITVFDGNTYAGDARIEDLAPKQERLISYALDLKTEVEALPEDPVLDLVSVRLRRGTLTTTKRASEATLYTIRNRDRKKKLVLVEHPFRSDWQLKQPSEAPERSRDVYRFEVAAAPDQTERLRVREERQISETVMIANLDNGTIAYYTRERVVSDNVKKALEKVVELRDRLNRTAAERERRQGRIDEISKEQARIRENMGKLAQSSDLYTRYVKKLDEQETELDRLREEIAKIQKTEVQQTQELDDYMLSLDVE